MVYPFDIYAKTQRGGKGKATDAEKAKIAIGIVFVVVTAIIFMTAPYWGAVGFPIALMVVVGIFVWLFISLQIFRFLIFREQDRDLEESDLFLPFYKIRPGSAKMKSIVGEYDMFELRNNSFVSVIQFRLGRNNPEKTAYTKEFLNKIQDIIHEKRLMPRMIWMKEDFTGSEEAIRMLNNVNSIKEPQLRASLLSIYNEVFSFTEEHGSVMCCYLMIYAPTNYVKDELEDAVVQITNFYRKTRHLHALRSIQYLDQRSLLHLFQRFYGMGAIDLSLSKVQFNTTDSEILKSIEVYRIMSKNGKSYGNPILDKVKTGVRFL